jgi:hypothetical protein
MIIGRGLGRGLHQLSRDASDEGGRQAGSRHLQTAAFRGLHHQLRVLTNQGGARCGQPEDLVAGATRSGLMRWSNSVGPFEL